MACINPLFISRMASTNTSMLIGQTFEDNLTLGLTLERSRLPPTCARAQRIAVLQSRYDSEMLYRLCKALEVTDSILGQEYFEGWADMSASSVTSILDPITRFKMALVQCVLAEPDVILINGFGDHLTHENLQKMGEFLRLWLDRKFPIIDDDFCGDVRVHRPRTIILARDSFGVGFSLGTTRASHKHCRQVGGDDKVLLTLPLTVSMPLTSWM